MENENEISKIHEELEEQRKILNSIRRTLRIGAIFSILRVIFILIPLVIAIIFLPSLYRQAKQSLGEGQGAELLPQGLNIETLRELLK